MQIKTPKPGYSSKPTRPERLGDYELLAELAHDPFGQLAAARSVSGQGAYDVVDVVALRSIQPSAWIDAWLVEDICQAAWGIKGQVLSHVLPVTDVIVADGRVGVVTDYSEGEFLRSLIRLSATRRIPFPVGVALRIALDLLMGMNSVQQVIGRKPDLAKLISGGMTADRMLVGAAGESEIAEVVLSGKVSVKPVLAQDDDALGYRAPEHYQPECEADVRSDLFVLGIVLWEMLASRPLFSAGEAKGQASKGLDSPTVQNVLKAPVEKLAAPSVPSALSLVVERALERDPAARFQTPAQFKEALETAAKSSIGTPADVARFVEQVAGQILASRKAIIHRALRLSDPGGQVPGSTPGGAIKVVPAPAPPEEIAVPKEEKKSSDSTSSLLKADVTKAPQAEKAGVSLLRADPTPAPGRAARPGLGSAQRKATIIGMPAVSRDFEPPPLEKPPESKSIEELEVSSGWDTEAPTTPEKPKDPPEKPKAAPDKPKPPDKTKPDKPPEKPKVLPKKTGTTPEQPPVAAKEQKSPEPPKAPLIEEVVREGETADDARKSIELELLDDNSIPPPPPVVVKTPSVPPDSVDAWSAPGSAKPAPESLKLEAEPITIEPDPMPARVEEPLEARSAKTDPPTRKHEEPAKPQAAAPIAEVDEDFDLQPRQRRSKTVAFVVIGVAVALLLVIGLVALAGGSKRTETAAVPSATATTKTTTSAVATSVPEAAAAPSETQSVAAAPSSAPPAETAPPEPSTTAPPPKEAKVTTPVETSKPPSVPPTVPTTKKTTPATKSTGKKFKPTGI